MEDWKMALQTVDQALDQRLSPLLTQLQANSLQLRLLSSSLPQRSAALRPSAKPTLTQRRCTTALTTPRTSAVKALLSPRASTGQTTGRQAANPFPRAQTSIGKPQVKPTPPVIRGKRPSQCSLPQKVKIDLQPFPSTSEFNGTAFPDDANSQDVSGVSPISHSSSSSLADLTSLVAQLS